jgi:hypothetical protein
MCSAPRGFRRSVVTLAALICAVVLAPPTLAQVGDPSANRNQDFAAGWQNGMPLKLAGELTVLFSDDFANHRAERLYFINDRQTRRSFQLQFNREPTVDLRTGSVVTVSGRGNGSMLYVMADQTDSSTTSTPTTQVISPAPPLWSGDQRTLVIIANFRDATVRSSVDSIANVMFADPSGWSVNALYHNASLGALWFSGDVVGPYTLNAASTDACDLGAWANAADSQASAAGMAPGAYVHKVYVMPPNSCPGAGFGTLGGSPSYAWIFASDLAGVFAHELGHNLGMDHAATPTSEYGDGTDPMAFGTWQLRGFNAPHRQAMGWLTTAAELVNQDGLYDLAPLTTDVAAATSQVVTISKPDTGEYYYLSYRQADGFDQYIDSSYYNRLSIHRYRADGSASKTYLLAALRDGESFVDSTNGVTVTLVSHDLTRATVAIHFALPCAAGVPSISVSPSTQSGLPGGSAAYTVSLTNTDTTMCSPNTFALTAAMPSGWFSALNAASLTLGPGMTGQSTLTVTSPSRAVPTTYTVQVNAIDAATPAIHTISATVSYSVTVPTVSCQPSVPMLSASPATQSGTAGSSLSFVLTLTNQDGATCDASSFQTVVPVPTGWWGIASPGTVTVGPGQSTQILLSVASASAAASANYGITVSLLDASQAAHSVSAGVNYTVISLLDTVPPSAPSGLTASVNQKQKQIQLSWNPATDNVSVVSYAVSRNGNVIANAATTNWIDTSYVAGATYTYFVVAYDGVNNASQRSNYVTVTLSGGNGTKKR